MDLFSFEIDNGDMSAIEDMDRGGGIAWASGDPLPVSYTHLTLPTKA